MIAKKKLIIKTVYRTYLYKTDVSSQNRKALKIIKKKIIQVQNKKNVARDSNESQAFI